MAVTHTFYIILADRQTQRETGDNDALFFFPFFATTDFEPNTAPL